MELRQIIKSEITFILEATNSVQDLHPNLKDNIAPIFLTWNEYYDKINKFNESHPDNAYDYKYDPEKKFKCPVDSTCKKINTVQINKIILEYYIIKTKNEYAKFDGDKYLGIFTDDEVEKMGRNLYSYTIICIHDGVVVGSGQDEWGCVLIAVTDEYRGLGIGEYLVKEYRKIYPYKPSGGFTSSGYTQIRKYYNYMVKQTLASGIYSDMVRKGEITTERVKEITNSINKNHKFSKDKKNKLKDLYGGNNEPIFIIDNNIVIIFDSALKDINSFDDIHDSFIQKMIYCYVYVNEFNDYSQVFNCYGDEKYIKMAIEILATLNPEGLADYYFRNFNPKIKSILEKIWNDNKYKKETIKNAGYIIGVDLNIIKPKNKIDGTINKLNNFKKNWFKTFDKYGEIEDRIHEIAYGYVED